MKILVNEIEKTGQKVEKWHYDNFVPSSSDKENIFNEAFRIALYSYIAKYFPNGFGLRTKGVGNLPEGQLGRILYCSGFQTNAILNGEESAIGAETIPDRTFEILVTQ